MENTNVVAGGIDSGFNFTASTNSTEMSSQVSEIALALSKAQSELESAKKDQAGYGYSYSNLADVIATAKPVLAKHDLAVTQLVGTAENNNPSVTTILVHKSGQFFKSVANMPPVEMKGTNAVQQRGATLSYLRRYAYQAIIGMSSEDNDASSHGFDKSGKTSHSKKAAPKKASATTEEKPRQKFRRKKVEDNDEDDI